MLCPMTFIFLCIAKCLGHGGVCKCLLKKLLNISEPENMVGPLIVTKRLTLEIFCFPEDSQFSSDIVSSDSRDTQAYIPYRWKTGPLLREHIYKCRFEND